MTPIDFSHLHGPNRTISLMPQWDFLNLLAAEGARYPGFRLLLGAEVTGLLRPRGRVAGVTAETADGPIEVRAPLTIGADGRDSTVRDAAGLVPRSYGIAIDVLWFRLPRTTAPPPDTLGYLNTESMVVTIPRPDYYQSGMLIPKGSFGAVQAAGLDEFRARIVRAAPFLGEVVGALDDWEQVRLLTVQVNRLERWWKPGVLCIGDAAHAMSPAFGVGINYAIQDAVAAARLLAAPLRDGTLTARDVRRVQRRRLPPVRLMQPIQLALHRAVAKPGGGAFVHNPMLRRERAIAAVLLPVFRRAAARMVGRGFRPERLGDELAQPGDDTLARPGDDTLARRQGGPAQDGAGARAVGDLARRGHDDPGIRQDRRPHEGVGGRNGAQLAGAEGFGRRGGHPRFAVEGDQGVVVHRARRDDQHLHLALLQAADRCGLVGFGPPVVAARLQPGERIVLVGREDRGEVAVQVSVEFIGRGSARAGVRRHDGEDLQAGLGELVDEEPPGLHVAGQHEQLGPAVLYDLVDGRGDEPSRCASRSPRCGAGSARWPETRLRTAPW